MDMASAIVAAVSNFSADVKSKGVEKPYPKTHAQFRHFLKNDVPAQALHSKHPQVIKIIEELKQNLRKIDSDEKNDVEKELKSSASSKERLYESAKTVLAISKAVAITSLIMVGATAIGATGVGIPIALGAASVGLFWLHYRMKNEAMKKEKKIDAECADTIGYIFKNSQNRRESYFKTAKYGMDWQWKSIDKIATVNEKDRRKFLSNALESVKGAIAPLVRQNAPEEGGVLVMLDNGPVFIQIENISPIRLLADISMDIIEEIGSGQARITEESGKLKSCLFVLFEYIKKYSNEDEKKMLEPIQNNISGIIDYSLLNNGLSNLKTVVLETANFVRQTNYLDTTRAIIEASKGNITVGTVEDTKKFIRQNPIENSTLLCISANLFIVPSNILQIHTHPRRPTSMDSALYDMGHDMEIAKKRGPHMMVCPSDKNGKSFEAWYIKPDNVEFIGDF